MNELDLIKEWHEKDWISNREFARLNQVEKREFPCGCYSLSYKETGKRINNYICSEHFGLPKNNDSFKPITITPTI